MSNIWVPKAVIVEPPEVKHTAKLEGKFSFVKYKIGVKEPVQILKAQPNLIVNQGIDTIGILSASCINGIVVGTGNTTPAVTDTNLATPLVWSDTVQVNWNSNSAAGPAPDYWLEGSGTWRFVAGKATGNLTEVGAGYSPSGNLTGMKLFSRSLIKDDLGNPISISILSDEYLDVSYTVRGYWDTTDTVDVVNIAGTDYTFTSRISQLTYGAAMGMVSLNDGYMSQGLKMAVFTGTAASPAPALGAVTDIILNGGSAVWSKSAPFDAYVSNSLTLTGGISLGLNEGNGNYGIRGISTTIGYKSSPSSSSMLAHTVQTIVTPPILKDASKLFSVSMSTSWGRKT